MNRPTRQLGVLRSLFRTLYPDAAGPGSGQSYLGASYSSDSPAPDVASELAATPPDPATTSDRKQPKASSSALRSITDEHLVSELQQITSNQTAAKLPRRSFNRKHYSREALLALLEEASVRIQVLETELEIARGDSNQIPLLTDEWDAPELAADASSD